MAEQFLAYGGRAVITFHSGKHYYTCAVPDLGITRLYQPGVTTIIGMKDKSAPLMGWAVKQMTARVKELLATAPDPLPKNILAAFLDAAQETYRDTKQEAADIGSLVHRVLEQALLGNFDESMLPLEANALLAPNLTSDMVELANNAIRAGLRFFGKHKIEVLSTERVVWSPKYAYVGTTDLLARVDGEMCVCDFKTAKSVYPENHIQLAAYQMALLEEQPELNIAKRWVIRVGKDGKLVDDARGNDTVDEDFLCFRALRKVWQWDRANSKWGAKEAVPVIGDLDEAIAKVTRGAA